MTYYTPYSSYFKFKKTYSKVKKIEYLLIYCFSAAIFIVI